MLHLGAGGELVASRRQRRNQPDAMLAAKGGERRIRQLRASLEKSVINAPEVSFITGM